MGLSTRSIRVFREDMKCIIIAAVLVAYVTVDGSMPTVSEVDMIPETELTQEAVEDAIFTTEGKFNTLGGKLSGAPKLDFKDALKDSVNSLTENSIAQINMAYDNVVTQQAGGEPSQKAEQGATGGYESNFNSAEGNNAIATGQSIDTGGLASPGAAVRTNEMAREVRAARGDKTSQLITELNSVRSD